MSIKSFFFEDVLHFIILENTFQRDNHPCGKDLAKYILSFSLELCICQLPNANLAFNNALAMADYGRIIIIVVKREWWKRRMMKQGSGETEVVVKQG